MNTAYPRVKEDLLYRLYGDALGIFMDVRRSALVSIQRLKLLARTEGDHPTGRHRDILTRLRIRTRTRAFVMESEVAEFGQLDLLTLLQL